MALITGLGNVGTKYSGTRHNIGFDVVDAVAASLSIRFEERSSLYQEANGSFKGQKVTLIKPNTFMNLSGRAVGKAMAVTDTPIEQCFVCYDDINLPVGKMRIRPMGSAGGHNGIQHIIDTLNSNQFPRLRMGVGNNFPKGRQADYVLSPFTPDEQPIMDETVEKAVDAILAFLRGGIDLAMNHYN